MNNLIDSNKLAQIEYHGTEGITSHCLDAIARLIHFGDRITSAKLLTGSRKHCFLLEINYGNLVAVKSGFSSGYTGEGPHGLSTALLLLKMHIDEIEEIQVQETLLQRLDSSCLLQSDIDLVNSTRPIRPARWHDYIYEKDDNRNYLRHLFPASIPFRLLDNRLLDLALKFEEQPDNSILSGFRRLEDLVRERTSLTNESGTKLYAKAFQGPESVLQWENIDPGEEKGRGLLFNAVYMAYRNRRAHKELDSSDVLALREFLLLNELFLLESMAGMRPKIESE